MLFFFLLSEQAFSRQADHDHMDELNSSHHDDVHRRTHHTESHSHSHSESIWFGLMTLIGMLAFLVFERVFNIIIDSRNSKIDENVCLLWIVFIIICYFLQKK